MSISLNNETRDLQRFTFLKYYDALKEKIHFTAECCQKYRLYRKMLRKKLFRIKFPSKKSGGPYVYIFQEWN